MSHKKKLTPAEEGEMAVFEDALAEAIKKKNTTPLEIHKEIVKRIRKSTLAEEGEEQFCKGEK